MTSSAARSFHFQTSGTSATYPADDNGATAGSGIPSGYAAPTTPGNPNGNTTTAADSKTLYDPAVHRQREVRVHSIHGISSVGFTLTIEDHLGNQDLAIVFGTREQLYFDPPLSWNKGIRATVSAGLAVLNCSFGAEVRR